MAELSPEAQAVMTAGTMGNTNVINDPVYRQCIAAALRAAADQVVPKDVDPWGAWTDKDEVRYQLLAIAAELENSEKSKRT